jgi:hypothetical protein
MSIAEKAIISRRDFVCQSELLAGAALLRAESISSAAEQEAKDPPPLASGGLPRRILGRTNVPITMFTLGTAPCGSLPPPMIAELVNCALDAG